MQSNPVTTGLTAHQMELLNQGRALDIELIGERVNDSEVWELFGFLDDVEYLWGSTGAYAESIGRTEDGRYFAAPSDLFRHQQRNGMICCWYR